MSFGDALKAVGEMYKAAKDEPGMTVARQELARTATTVAKAINVALLPIAVLNYGYEKAKTYFTEKFEGEMKAKAAAIPPDQVVEPKASVAGPAIQGLAFSHDEPDLKEMYLNLLKSAMDGRTASRTHPAFVEIIRQLTAEEADLLHKLLRNKDPSAVVEIRVGDVTGDAWRVVRRHIMNLVFLPEKVPVVVPTYAVMVDNWVRLGLVEVSYSLRLASDDAYQWVQSRPEFIEAKASYETEKSKVFFAEGQLYRTAFGAEFAQIVGIVPADEVNAKEDPGPQ